MMSITLEFRRSGQSSLKVRPSTLTLAPRCSAGGDHLLDGLFGDEGGHPVVDAPAGQDDLGMVAGHLGLVGQVVRVDADAMAAHQARLEGEKIPLGAGSGQNFAGIDAEAVGK